jgi:hypothetical protein
MLGSLPFATLVIGAVTFSAHAYDESKVVVEMTTRGTSYVNRLGRVVMLRREWDSMVEAQAGKVAA